MITILKINFIIGIIAYIINNIICRLGESKEDKENSEQLGTITIFLELFIALILQIPIFNIIFITYRISKVITAK